MTTAAESAIAIILSVGMLNSGHLGETWTVDPTVAVSVFTGQTRLVVRWDSADKIESRKGWTGEAGVERMVAGPVFAGVGYRHRDGGPWTKRAALVKAGLWWKKQGMTVAVVQDVTTVNRVTEVEVGVAWGRKVPFGVAVTGVGYRDGHGVGRLGVVARVEVGWRMGR